MCYPGVRLALSLSLSLNTSSSPCLFPPLSDTIDSWPHGLSLSFPWVFPEFLPAPSLGKAGLCGDMDDEPRKLFLILRSQLFSSQLPLEVSHRGLRAERVLASCPFPGSLWMLWGKRKKAEMRGGGWYAGLHCGQSTSVTISDWGTVLTKGPWQVWNINPVSRLLWNLYW